MIGNHKLFDSGIEFSQDQQAALDAVYHWRASWPGGKQYLTLGGYAGTGKTTLIASLLRNWRRTGVVAPTGKAVNRLKQCGIDDAKTIHALIYSPWTDENGKTRFTRRPSMPYETLICDEASMVNQTVFNDLLSYAKPILWVGDHGQLEPIGESPKLMKNPDVRLETIHRQQANNPILRLAAAWREGREKQVFAAIDKKGCWSDPAGKCIVTSKRDIDGCIRSGAQVICGFNKTRHSINATIRRHKDYGGKTPRAGESLICLQNNKMFNVYNGQLATVIEADRPKGGNIDLDLQLDDGVIQTITCLVKQFGEDAIADFKDRNIALFDFSYCLSAHKSQGSEFQSVIVLEEISSSWDPRKWRYTSTTRARESLVYCL